MSTYADRDERNIRVKRLVDAWLRSGLIERAQHEPLVAGLHVDLRRTNLFLRLTLFGFGLLIIMAAAGLAVVTLDVNDEAAAGALLLVGGAASAVLAEFLIGRFRVYRFGIEEACAVGAAALVSIGAGLMAVSWRFDRRLGVALLAGSAAAFVVYRRFGYVYAALAAMLCASLAPFQLDLPDVEKRGLAAAVLTGCFVVVRLKRLKYGDEFPGDGHGTIQAAAWLGIYAVLNLHLLSSLNLHLFFASFARPHGSSFYWFTYAIIWVLPAAGLWWSIRDRDRSLLGASLVMALVTLATNKPYLDLARKPWDPILLGVLLTGGAIILRRWLASGADGSRRGFTATRLLRSDRDALASTAIASAATHQTSTHSHADPSSPDPFKGEGGRSGGGGAGGSF